MEAQKVDMFIMTNAKYFEGYQITGIRDRLIAMDDSKWAMISSVQLKDPTISLIISILAGQLFLKMASETGITVSRQT